MMIINFIREDRRINFVVLDNFVGGVGTGAWLFIDLFHEVVVWKCLFKNVKGDVCKITSLSITKGICTHLY